LPNVVETPHIAAPRKKHKKKSARKSPVQIRDYLAEASFETCEFAGTLRGPVPPGAALSRIGGAPRSLVTQAPKRARAAFESAMQAKSRKSARIFAQRRFSPAS